ncbi:expressed unknown protein [Seminavis robusta]|uniref:Uncharacterized protein n=1 Tax=Seminavis robusta TaxID=568900 RepID=A0A9N8HHC8_9STRA|nr:expressed unknown protein [Seminavis robusta]|eukprot:Sro555_g165790.1 n/a (186) ;mRNA; r:49571-50128
MQQMTLVLLVIATILALAHSATLKVTTATSDGSTLVPSQWNYRATSTCCWLPGCFVVDILQDGCLLCRPFTETYGPLQEENTYTFTPNREDGLFRCYCMAEYDPFSFVELVRQNPDGQRAFGFFRVVPDDTAGTTANISCTKLDDFRLDCEEEVHLDWDVKSATLYEVTVTLFLCEGETAPCPPL